MSSPSSRLEDVKGDEEALLFGVDEAAPSTQRSPGAGRRGEASGGVWTLVPLPEPFFPDMGADMLGRLVLIVDRGRTPSSLSFPRSVFPVKQWLVKFSLLHVVTLCWMNLTISDNAKGFWHDPHVSIS